MSDLIDFNILNRATFDSKPIKQTITVSPTLYQGTASYNLGNSVFWVKSIEWKFGYFDVGLHGANRRKLEPIKVTVSGGTEAPLLVEAEEPMPPFEIPKPIATRIDFEVRNTNLGNNHQLKVEFILKGILVTPKPGVTEPLNLKEQYGYIMSSESKKGELAMAEAAVDALESKMASMGIDGGIRSKLPQGLGVLKALPPSLQSMIVKQMGAEYAAALPDNTATAKEAGKLLALNADPEKEKSALMGDLISCLPESASISREDLKKVAEQMIAQGWRRI